VPIRLVPIRLVPIRLVPIRMVVAKSRMWCEYELDGTWVATEKGKAGTGMTYHPDKDLFSSPQPYP